MKTLADYLIEAEGPRIPHPEDSIFMGSAEAAKNVQALQSIITNPQKISIKWDGMIALYFGNDASGQFFISDKYMPAKGVFPHSPNEWIQYDQSRGANRSDLYAKINLIWPGLQAAVGDTPGVFKGDLMFIGPLRPVQGQFVFKPVTVEYHVPVESELGQLISGRRALIVVHEYNKTPWNGQGLASNNQVAIIPPSAGIRFKVRATGNLAQQAAGAVSKYGNAIGVFLHGMTKTAQDALSKYLIHTKIGKTNLSLSEWLRGNVSAKQFQVLIGDDNNGYIIQNRAALTALFKTWNAISNFKENIAQQLETQVQGFQQFVNGQPQGEGFVFPSKHGLVKLVQRGGFTAAHFAGFNAKK